MAQAREAWMAGQPDLDPDRLVFVDETGASTKMVRLRGRCRRGERAVGSLIGSIAFGFTIILGRRLRGTSDTTLVT